MNTRDPVARRLDAFNLVELLVVIAILAVLASLLLPALTRGKESAHSTRCVSQMHQIGLALRVYADANNDEFPRSQHSAFACGQLPWGRALAPELGCSPAAWTNLLNGLYHCPSDRRELAWSYGQNVYFELNPDNDDYTASPQTWRHMMSVPKPASTILHAENASEGPGGMGADHMMAHFWTSIDDASDVAQRRHRTRSNYSFVDGHVQGRRFPTTFDPGKGIDLWNPGLAP